MISPDKTFEKRVQKLILQFGGTNQNNYRSYNVPSANYTREQHFITLQNSDNTHALGGMTAASSSFLGKTRKPEIKKLS